MRGDSESVDALDSIALSRGSTDGAAQARRLLRANCCFICL